MDIARSIYSGGAIIKADDDSLTYSSYLELGLRCPICGEEVHLRKGEYRKPHFAHFHKTDHSEECTLRLKVYTQFHGWKHIVEGKEQRKEIFQKYFLNIIIASYPDFHKKINSKKYNEIVLKEAVKKCIDDFHSKNTLYISKYCLNNSNDARQILNHQITIEAFDYLFVQTSHKSLLQEIIKYLSSQNIATIYCCLAILRLLQKIDWVRTISNIRLTNKPNHIHISDKTTKRGIKDNKHKTILEQKAIGDSNQSQIESNTYKNIDMRFYTRFSFSENQDRFIVSITGHINYETKNVSIKKERKKFFCTYSYSYCIGDVFIKKYSAKNQYFEFIGKLTENEFVCKYNQDFYKKVSREIENRYLKSITSKRAYIKLKNKIMKRGLGKIQKSEKNYIKGIQNIKVKKKKKNRSDDNSQWIVRPPEVLIVDSLHKKSTKQKKK